MGFNKDALDTRVVSYGIRWLIDHYISKQWTQHDIDCAEIFYRYVSVVQKTWSLMGQQYDADGVIWVDFHTSDAALLFIQV